MENAIDIVKEKADYITLSNDNDGIADYLEKSFNNCRSFRKKMI